MENKDDKGGEDYLTIEVRSGYFVVALNVFLDSLTGGTITFFELQRILA
jgi:hypothetical protein